MGKFYSRIFFGFFILLCTLSAKSQITAYSFTALSGTYTPITGGTNPSLSSTSLDDSYATIPIGFNFIYNGVTYTSLAASTNGVIELGASPGSIASNNLATGTTARPYIAPLWDDLKLSASTDINYVVTGTNGSRVLTVQWSNVKWNYNATAASVSFQVKLYETTGVIEFIYDTIAGGTLNAASASIGLSGVGTGSGNYLSLNNASASPTVSSTSETTTIATRPASGQIYRWTPPPTCNAAPAAGTISASPASGCYGSKITLTNTGSTSGVANLSYQWQYAPISSSSWTDIPGATLSTYTFIATNSFQYRFKITCSTNGLSDFSPPLSVAISNMPTYATFPYTQDFESWVDGCSTTDRPDAHWGNIPSTSDSSWRRNDQGSSANWSGNSGAYSPAFSTGAHSARFHSYDAASKTRGSLDLFINLNDPAPTKYVKFDYINTSGSDSLVVYLSTDGGLTFSKIGNTLKTATAWTAVEIPIASNSATAVIRLQATSDFGTTDIGVDNFAVVPVCNGAPSAGTVSASPTAGCYGSSITLSNTGATSGVSNLAYQWQYAPISSSTWSNLPGATTLTYTFNAVGSFQYRLKITCSTSGLTDFSAPVTVAISNTPSYATFPYTQDFESWVNGCSTNDRPDAHWGNIPATSDSSWRRNDQGSSANWTSTSGAYTPAAATGTYSARFHSYDASSKTKGALDLFIDLSSNPSTNKYVRFNYINTSGTDSLVVLLSNDGGINFTKVGSTLTTQATWTNVEIPIASASATAVIRLQATSDFGTTDIGVDNFAVALGCTGAPSVSAATATPSALCYGSSALLKVPGIVPTPGLTYQWQSSPNGTTWTNIAGATDTVYTTPGLTANMQYRLVVKCTPTNTSVNSAPAVITITMPTYATLPYTQGFENWINGCATTDKPDASWGLVPVMSDSAWRRDDQGTSANWSGTNGAYSPAFSEGAHSARFHSYNTTGGRKGIMDLFVNMGSVTGLKELRFDYINTSGTDSLVVLLSTNGGSTFTRLDSITVRPTWTTKSIQLNTNATTAVIRFMAVSDFGSTDIGIDNLKIITPCTAAPSAGTIAGPAGNAVCVGRSATLTLSGQSEATGITYQWQSSTDNTTFSDISGATGTSYVATPTGNTYYRVVVTCTNSSTSTPTASVQINVLDPQITGVTGVTRCGPGNVPLFATATPGATINWFASATGGAPLAQGPTFTTPIIPATTTYYVSATQGGGSSQVGLSPTATNCGNITTSGLTDWPLRFNTTTTVTINSAYVVPQAAGTLVVALRAAQSSTNIQSVSFNFTAAQVGVPQQISLGFVVPAGSYQLTNTSGGVSRVGTFTCTYPFTSAYGGFSIVGSATTSTSATNTNTYNSFFWISVSEGCESPRTAVTATISPAPAFNITTAATICNNAVKTLTVTTPQTNFDTYTWSPVAGLYTDASATTPYTGGSATTVYVKNNTAGLYTYIATANNNSTSCQNIDSMKVTVLPAAATIVSSVPQICTSGPATLSLSPATGYGDATIQWYSSTDNGATYTSISGANAVTYTTGNLTTTTTFKAVITGEGNSTCLQPTYTVNVFTPLVVTTTPGARCGPGTVQLSAAGSANTTLNWYDNANGGTLIGTGNSVTTPSLTASANFYVSAFQTSSTGTAGRPTPLPASTGDASDQNGLVFSATQPFTLNSVDIYSSSTAGGSIMVQLTNSGGTVLQTAGPFTIPPRTGATLSGGATPTTIPLGFNIPVGTGYRLRSFTHTGALLRDNPIGSNFSYPLPIGSVGNITSGLAAGSTSSTSYYYFYNWQFSTGCTSPRTPVLATVSTNTVVTNDPATQATCAGATVTFSVDAVGATLTYQWRKGGTNIAGATSNTYTINAATVADAGNYDVIVSGLCGKDTSAAAVLTVAATNTWLGAANNDWNNAGNWCGGIPTSISDIVIPSGTPFQPTLNSVGNVHNMTINSGATLTIAPSAFLNSYGDLTNNGTVTAPAGIIAFRGTANQNVSALSAGTFLMNGAGITLTGNMTVGSALIMTAGNITLGSNNLNLNVSADGNAASHIVTNGTGAVIANNVTTTAITVPVGPDATHYNPAIISNGQGRNYSVKVATGVTPAILNNSRAINRTWTITPSSQPASPVNIVLQFADGDVNSNAVPTLVMEAGVYNGTQWNVVSPPTGVTPSGTADARQVGISTTQFGPTVIANIGGLTTPLAIPNVDNDVTSIMMMPNPVHDHAILRVNVRRTMNVVWNVIDANGRFVMVFSKQVLSGQNDLQLDLSHLASGIYQIIGNTGKGKTQLVRFVKL